MLTAIIIDDQSSSRSALKQKIVNHCPEVVVIDEGESGEEGIRIIEEKKPDIVFLDVEMPRMNGFTMLQQLRNRDFEVIFITAYDNYAITAIRFSALDYLVKPIEVGELKLAVEKAIKKREQLAGNRRLELLLENLIHKKTDRQHIVVSSMEELYVMRLEDIIYLEANSNYTLIYKKDGGKKTVSKTLKDFEELLPDDFVRIHHGFIINCNAVDRYIKGEGGQVVMKNGVVLDVSKRKKAEFLKAIGY